MITCSNKSRQPTPGARLAAYHASSARRGCAVRLVLMRLLPTLLFALVFGCSSTQHNDPRLSGTWRLDHSKIPNRGPGEMTLTFSNSFEQISGQDRTSGFSKYRVLESGTNYVLIEHLVGPHYRERYTFAEDGEALLVPQSTGSYLRFERSTVPPTGTSRFRLRQIKLHRWLASVADVHLGLRAHDIITQTEIRFPDVPARLHRRL